ncbi:MAG TPA: hypothetical protein VFG45_11165 [Candidatus Nitrosocosmicus sp.]|nr:hypothetical protein [Candidatus Nitrosocosmicus sp.]
MSDLRNRRLFKRAYEKDLNLIDIGKSFKIMKNPEILKEYVKKLSEKSSIPKELIIAFVSSNELGLKGYKSSRESIKSDEMPYLYVDDDGKAKTLDDKFAIVRKENIPSKLFVCTKQEHVSKLRSECVKLFG